MKPDDAVERAIDAVLGGEVSAQTKKVLVDQVRAANETPLVKAFALALGSPEFQRR